MKSHVKHKLYRNALRARARREEGGPRSLHGVFDDFGVEAGHSVDSMRSHNAQVGHVDLLVVPFLDQGHSAQAVKISGEKLGNALEGEAERRMEE